MDFSFTEVAATAGSVVVILNAYDLLKKKFGKNTLKNHEDIKKLKTTVDTLVKHDEEHMCLIETHKTELKILCKGILACLKGLEEQGCNGPVHEGIDELEKHLLDSSH